MTPDQIIEVVQAYKEGKIIESRSVYTGGEWFRVDFPSWNFDSVEYRIKPQLIERWVNVYEDGVTRSTFVTKYHAENCRVGGHVRTVLLREVTE